MTNGAVHVPKFNLSVIKKGTLVESTTGEEYIQYDLRAMRWTGGGVGVGAIMGSGTETGTGTGTRFGPVPSTGPMPYSAVAGNDSFPTLSTDRSSEDAKVPDPSLRSRARAVAEAAFSDLETSGGRASIRRAMAKATTGCAGDSAYIATLEPPAATEGTKMHHF
jgi:hypothetical protein